MSTRTSEQQTPGLRIGELARRTGASVRALRHYDAAGLLETRRTAAGYRVFPESAVEEVARIRLLIRNGFTVEEIRLVVTPGAPHAERPDRREVCAAVIDLYRRKLAELDERLAVLRDVRERAAARLARLEAEQAAGGP